MSRGFRARKAKPKTLRGRRRWGQSRVILEELRQIATYSVSQHLKVLKEAGLVTERAAGNRRIYQVNEAGLAALRDQLDAFWNRAMAGYHNVVEQQEEEQS